MNYFFKRGFPAVLLLILLAGLDGCKKKDPDPREERMKVLAGTWRLGTVENDATDVTALYSGFTLTIAANRTFATVNGHNAWPASGAFEFVGADLNKIIREDGVEVTIGSATTTSLQLTLTQSEVAAGRVRGVTGQFVFSLVK